MSRRYLAAAFVLIANLIANTANAIELDTHRYDIYYGDINGDSYTDVYLQGKEIFVPIAGEVFIPLILPAPQSVVMYRDTEETSSCPPLGGSCTYTTTAKNHFTAPELLELSATEVAQLILAQAGDDFLVGDLDADGKREILIRGLAGTPRATYFDNGHYYETVDSAPLALVLTGSPDDEPFTISQTLTDGTLTYHSINDHNATFVLQDANNDGRDDLVVLNGAGVADIVYEATSAGQIDGNHYTAIVGSTPQIPTFFGSTAGAFNVNETGNATYSIPISVPVGTAGVTPEISLVYSSNGANGIAGQGWSLGGLSAIARCRKTYAIDGDVAPIQWDDNDRFCIDGQRLIVVDGVYGAVGATYKTELDDFTKIKSVGGVSGSPLYFKVLKKDGTVTTYGETIDSRQLAGGNVLSWSRSQIKDSVSNAINYSYSSDADGHRIAAVRYAYGTGSTYHAEITFDYDDRPDPIIGYTAGELLKTAKRLNAIIVKNRHQGSLETLRTYNLHYQFYDPISQNETSLLGSVQECAPAGCLPAITFDWQQQQDNFESPQSVQLLSGGQDFITTQQYFDVNGDGQMDMIWVDEDTYSPYYKSLRYFTFKNGKMQAATFDDGSPQIWFPHGGYKYPVKIAIVDYNGDGRQDVAVYRGSLVKWELYLSTHVNGEWQLAAQPITLPFTAMNTIFIDVNADGLADALSNDTVYHLEPNPVTGNLPEPYAYQAANGQAMPWVGEQRGFTDCPVISNTGITSPTQERTEIRRDYISFGDINGDGATDTIGVEHRFCMFVNFQYEGDHIYAVTNHESHMYVLERQGNNWFKRKYLGSHNAQYLADSDSGLIFTRKKVFQDATSNQWHEPTYNSFIDEIASDGIAMQASLRDVNNDGLADMIQQKKANGSSLNYLYPKAKLDHYLLLSNGAGFESPKYIGQHQPRQTAQYADLNRDGKADFIWHDVKARQLRYRLFDEDTFGAAQILRSTAGYDEQKPERHRFIDVNGDKRVDYLREIPNPQDQQATLETYLARGDLQPDNTIVTITNSLGAKTHIEYGSLAQTDAYEQVDLELSYRYSNPNVSVNDFIKPSCPTCPTNDPGLTASDKSSFWEQIHSDVAQGIWDLPTDYVAGQQIMPAAERKPVLGFRNPVYVVTRVASTSPAANDAQPYQVDQTATRAVAYRYSGARMQASGRGFLGFQYLKTMDEQTGIKTTTMYRQDYPFIGAPLQTVTYDPNGNILKTASNDWHYRERTGTDGTHYYQTYLANTKEVTKVTTSSLGAGFNVLTGDQKVQEVINNYDDYGNLTRVETKITGQSAAGVITRTEVTQNTYGVGSILLSEWGSNESYEQLGRLTSASASVNLNGQTATRNTSFTYHNTGNHAGLLFTETLEPGGDQTLTTTTTHHYDVFGNEVRTVTTGWDGSAVIDREASLAFDSLGRYVNKEYNHFDQLISEVVSRDERGSPLVMRDLASVEVTLSYDGLGRESYRSDSTGAWSETLYLNCAQISGCPSGAVYAIKNRVSGGGESIEYFDKLGRTVRQGAIHFSGQWAYTDTEYDNIGRHKRSSEPFLGSQAQYWTTQQYDILNQPVQVHAPDGTTASNSYDGFELTQTNHFGHQHIETRNVLGQLQEVIDNLGGKITYAYNIDGELASIKSYRAGETTAAAETTLEYDALGRKIATEDPDKGRWTYSYNAFGELISQTNANNQVVTQTYDAMGRMLTRRDVRANSSLEQFTQWVYDNSAAAVTNGNNSRGQLTQVLMGISTSLTCSGTTTRECTTYSYDNLGRVLNTEQRLRSPSGQDLGSYVTAVAYDSIGRPAQSFDALNGLVSDAQGLINSGIQTEYNAYGFAFKTTDIHTGDLLDEIKTRDARGNVTERLLGANGATTYFTYDPANGRLLNQRTDIVGISAPIQLIDYEWDELGNLKYRHNQSSGKNLQESFCYDGLNRLIKTNSGTTATSACSGLTENAQDFKYDSLGNITYKHDVGNYTYGNVNTVTSGDAGLHAVVTTSDGHTYEYDNNGNMILDRNGSVDDRRFSYSTFDKPIEIEKVGQHTVKFAYGQNRSRYWREDTDSNGVVKITLYLGGLERISHSNSATVEWKRYIGESLHTVKVDSNGDIQSIDKRVLYKDHLGSIDVITDAAGAVIQAMSFDPWGKRRNPDNWQALTLASLIGFDTSETTKGFTGHEMLDAVGIIHMNGRIYDPRLARFLQADPHVQAPNDTQMLNRYSYVRNNPLNATDPSGYVAITLMATMALAFGKVTTAWVVGLVIGSAAFMDAAASGAGLGEAFRSGVIAGLSAAAFVKIGQHFKNISDLNMIDYQPGLGLSKFGGNMLTSGQIAQQIAAHAAVGGVAASLQGGKFGHGFLSAGVTKGVTGAVHGGHPLIRVAASATIGGTVSEVSGGKFANGAQTAVYQYLYNEWLSKAASLVVQLAPGYEIYQCFSEDCSALEWAMAASTLTPAGKLLSISRKAYMTAGKAGKVGSGVPNSGALSAKQGANLKEHLRQTEKYGQGGVKELQNGKIRYSGNISPAHKPGEMAGRRTVREWDPATGNKRTWHETVDHNGNIRIVRPQRTDNVKTHYQFDADGNYTGKF